MNIVNTANGFQVTLPDGTVLRDVKVNYPAKATEYQRTELLRERIRDVLIQINNQPPKALLEWRKKDVV